MDANIILSATSGLRVLVVEDHPINRRVVQLMLEPLGVQVTFAENGLAGVEAWARQAFDAVLMDVQMPVMDGLTAVRAIRQLEQEHDLPRIAIAMVSANIGSDCEAAADVAGADGYIAKPVNLEALTGGIVRALDHARSHGRPQSRAA